jgi:phosphate:Na+ symporter
LTDIQSKEFQSLMSATINLESLADVIESELVDIGKDFIDHDLKPSDTTRLLLQQFAAKVQQAVEDTVKAIRESDETAAEAVIAIKDDVRLLADKALQLQSERIGVREERHLDLVRMELELLDNLRRIYTLAKRVARDFVPEEVASKA